MKLSLWSQYFFELSPEDAVLEFIKNGIFACELSTEHGQVLLDRSENVVETGRAFARFIEEHAFSIPQGHLWLHVKICSETNVLPELFRWIDLYEAIGIRNLVLHCDDSLPKEWSFEKKAEQNILQLQKIAEHVKDKNVRICLENLRGFVQNAQEITYIIDRVGSDHFGICLDTGHLNLTAKDQRAFILHANKRLHAVHIADNEGERDQHMMPFTRGTVNFVEVMRALREVGYDGLFNLEIPGESSIPLVLRAAKIQYIKSCYDYLTHCE